MVHERELEGRDLVVGRFVSDYAGENVGMVTYASVVGIR